MAKLDQQLEDATELHLAGRLDEAEVIYRGLLAENPQHSDASHLLGVIAKQCGYYLQAIELITQAIENGKNNPNLADYHNNCGEIYRALFQPAKAMPYYQAALALRPDFYSAIYNLGNCHQQLGDHHQALSLYEQTLKLKPDHRKVLVAQAMSLLTLGRFQEGWLAYEKRIQMEQGRAYLAHPANSDLSLPPPSTLSNTDWCNKHVLLLANQGLGDELFFLRYAHVLISKHANIEYQASAKLLALLQRNQLIPLKTDDSYGHYDAIFGVSELPLVTGMDGLEDIQGSVQLSADENIVAQFQQQFSELPKPWIGITWRGGSVEKLFKEIPLLDFIQVFKQCQGSLFIMQRQPKADEIQLITEQLGHLSIVDASDVNDDLEQALAMLSLLNRYIAVSNTNIHLRATLGQQCEILLPLVVDFRWPNTQAQSPWFPNFPIYKQCVDGSWSKAIDELEASI